MKFKNERSKKLHEYERLSTEILQDQKVRITIFTFSITTTALILGFSFNTTLLIETIVAIAAIYSVLIPSVILIYHYTRSVNSKSEYLHLAFGEQWMKDFNRLTEEIIPIRREVKKTHRVMITLGAYSTQQSFTIAYTLLNVFIFTFGLIRCKSITRSSALILIGFFIVMFVVMRIFRPIRKREYRKLWQIILN